MEYGVGIDNYMQLKRRSVLYITITSTNLM